MKKRSPAGKEYTQMDYVNIQRSVGDGGANNAGDVVRIQHLLLDLIIKKKLLGTNGVAPTGLIDANTILAIRMFQVQTGCSLPDGRVDPNGNTLKVMNKSAGHKKPTPDGYVYTGSTGWGISAAVTIGIVGIGGGVAGMVLYVADSDGSNKFKVVCSGGQLASGIGLGPPVSGSLDYSTKEHPATGGPIARLPNGSNPLTPEDFDGVVLMEAASAGGGAFVPGVSNKGSVAMIRTFKRRYWPIVLATLAAQTVGTAMPHIGGAATVGKKGLDRLANTYGWIAGGASSWTMSAGVEGIAGVFKSRVAAGD